MLHASAQHPGLPTHGNVLQIILVCISASSLLTLGASAQESAPEEPAPLLPIALSDIPARAAADNAVLDQSELLLSRLPVFDEIEEDLLVRERTIAKRLVSLNSSLAAASSREAISELEQDWVELERVLDDWERELRDRTGVIEQQARLLNARVEVWRQTLQEAEAAKAPQELIDLARDTSEQLVRTERSLAQMQERALALQGKAGRAHASVREALDRVAAEETDLLKNLTRRERPPLWSESVTRESARELGSRAQRELSEWWSSIYSIVRSEPDRVVFQVLFLLAATMLLRRARKPARAWAAADPNVALGMSVFDRPVALAALAALSLTPWLYVSTPPAVDDAVGLLLVLPVLWLVLPLLDKPIRPVLYLLAGLYVVDRLRDLVEAAPLVARLIFVFEMIAAIAILVWLIRSRALHGDGSVSLRSWRNRIRFGLDVALLLVTAALLAAISGFVRLAVLIGYGVLNSAYLALLLAALVRAADAAIALVLHSRAAQTIKVVSSRTQALRRYLGGVFAIAAGVIWVFVALDLFALRDYVVGFFGKMLFAELRAGAIAVSLADVLAFGVTIAGAVLLARLLTVILEEDVYSRVELGRGVPFAISSVAKYSIIALGFLLAIGAMGIGMDKIAILLGAFGVGLGFGLQNVVNNFVSGLILVFERPVQVGDSVEVGSVAGRITRIGIRSSTIRSFEGADITLPNGNLLSNALTNWTMTDRTRRIEVKVGVAYGTDPDDVIEVLKGALEGQDGLLEQPEPQVLFSGFGDNSLDFVLRAWVADNDQFVRIRSKIALAVNKGLKERGIEVPFPQRDLHLRSISPDVSLPGMP